MEKKHRKTYGDLDNPATEVDPPWWTPDPLGRRYPSCRDQDRPMRRSTGAKWSSWFEPDVHRRTWHGSSSRQRRRSADVTERRTSQGAYGAANDEVSPAHASARLPAVEQWDVILQPRNGETQRFQSPINSRCFRLLEASERELTRNVGDQVSLPLELERTDTRRRRRREFPSSRISLIPCGRGFMLRVRLCMASHE